MSNRYLEPVRTALAQRYYRPAPGIGLAVVPATEQVLGAEAIAEATGGAVAVLPTDVPGLDALPGLVVATLPRDLATARQSLIVLNGSRSRVSMFGRLLIVVVDRGEFMEFQRLAGDARSVLRFTIDVPFVPRPGVDPEAARRELAAWQRARFGKLDLRGFIRAHTEDVAWSVETLYQDLRATAWPGASDRLVTPGMDEGEPLLAHLERIFGHSDEKAADAPARAPGAVILGHPGAGKTFFLRWLTLHAAGTDALFGVNRPLPLLLPLSVYAAAYRPLTLAEHAVETLLLDGQPAAHVFDALADAGRVLFLLDGLDEVGDAFIRGHVAADVNALAERFPRCRIVATSRISGYTEAPIGGRALALAPLDDAAIERFLVTWSELYAAELHGPDAATRGRGEGQRLARDVLKNPSIAALARNPLMLTVVAIVHRAGVRLPDHRVELYSHATQVLVERWNQVRSLGTPGGSVPIKAADAARLLGPVALAVVRSNIRGAIPEDTLREQLEHAIEAGRLRAITSAGEALALFQRSLGLLVEQAPGMYAFLHLTLAEYFAAWELVRTGNLGHLTKDPAEVFEARWRETVLLAAGLLSVLHADDIRLDEIVRALIVSAGRRQGKPSPGVPSLLAGLLSDDPGLSQRTAEALVDCLIPTWWFERKYGINSMEEVFEGAFRFVQRLWRGRGRWYSLVCERLRRHFEPGLSPVMQQNLARDPVLGQFWMAWLKGVLFAANVDDSGIFFQHAVGGEAARWLALPLATHASEQPGGVTSIVMGRRAVEAVQRGALRLEIGVRTDGQFTLWQGAWERAMPNSIMDRYMVIPPASEASTPLRGTARHFIRKVEVLGPLDDDGDEAGPGAPERPA